MAIQNRRGNYSDFDPEKMVPGEWATVLSGDSNAGDGKSIYHCFSAGNVKRMATYEDMEDNINKATDDIRNEFLEDINNATQSANTAAKSAKSAAQTAQKAAQDAQNAAEAIEGAVEGTIINDNTASKVTVFSGMHVKNGYLEKTGNATKTTVKFAPPNEEQDLVSGETSGTLFGKIVKKLSVIKAAIGTLSSLTTTNKSSLVGAVNELNSAFAKSNMDTVWINQEGTYTFSLPIGKMAVVITYHGIYPHYSSSSGISANQLGGDTENENVITSVNNAQRTVSVYNKGDGAIQAVIFMPRQ